MVTDTQARPTAALTAPPTSPSAAQTMARPVSR